MDEFSELIFDFNKVLLAPEFVGTLEEIKRLDVTQPNFIRNYSPGTDEFLSSAAFVVSDGNIQKIRLNLALGQNQLSRRFSLAAYDESIIKFVSLEGVAYFTSHALVLLSEHHYTPVNYLTFYFYTKSREIVGNSKYIRFSENPELDSKKDYIKDRIQFLDKVVPRNTLLLIDGPLIAGDVYTHLIQSNAKYLERNIYQLFFVKNSSSDLVIENIPGLKSRFNSDLHWSYQFLEPGERTNFFRYRDRVNPENAKAFCYLKAFDLSPQRVECQLSTYELLSGDMHEIMDVVYYYLIVQGDRANPQIRPIAIAEKYARETLKLVNTKRIIKETGIIPTMNQTRFGA